MLNFVMLMYLNAAVPEHLRGDENECARWLLRDVGHMRTMFGNNYRLAATADEVYGPILRGYENWLEAGKPKLRHLTIEDFATSTPFRREADE